MASHGITIFIYVLQQDSRGRKHLRARAGTLLYNSLLVMRRPSETFCSSSHCKLKGKTLPTCSFENAVHLPSNTKQMFSLNDLYLQCACMLCFWLVAMSMTYMKPERQNSNGKKSRWIPWNAKRHANMTWAYQSQIIKLSLFAAAS